MSKNVSQSCAVGFWSKTRRLSGPYFHAVRGCDSAGLPRPSHLALWDWSHWPDEAQMSKRAASRFLHAARTKIPLLLYTDGKYFNIMLQVAESGGNTSKQNSLLMKLPWLWFRWCRNGCRPKSSAWVWVWVEFHYSHLRLLFFCFVFCVFHPKMKSLRFTFSF